MTTEWFVRSESIINQSKVKNTPYLLRNVLCNLIHLILNRYKINFLFKNLLNYLFSGETFETYCQRNLLLHPQENNNFSISFSNYYFSEYIETPPLFIFSMKQNNYYQNYNISKIELSLKNSNHSLSMECLKGFLTIDEIIKNKLKETFPDHHYRPSLNNNKFHCSLRSDKNGYYKGKLIYKNNYEYPKTKYIVDIFQSVDWISLLMKPCVILNNNNNIFYCHWKIKRINIIK